MRVGNNGRKVDGRAAARKSAKPQASRQPHTGLNKAKDRKKVDATRGRGAGTTQGKAPRARGASGRAAR